MVAVPDVDIIGDGEAVKLDGGVMEVSEGIEGSLSSFRGRLAKGCAVTPTTALAQRDGDVSK